MRGKVKWFDDEKGYGFIVREDGKKDCFIHYTEAPENDTGYQTLSEGEAVEFEVVGTERGDKAVAVRRV